jgi:spermidine synthase
VYFAPTDFYGGLTSFSLCFKGDVHPKRIDKARVKEFTKQNKLGYYSHSMHHSVLTLPGYLKDILKGGE